MSAFSGYFRIRFIIMMVIGVPYAVSIILSGGPKDREETVVLLFVLTGLLLVLGLGNHALDRREHRAQLAGPSEDEGGRKVRPSKFTALAFLGGCSSLVAALAVALPDSVARSGWSVENCLGALLAGMVLVIWVFAARGTWSVLRART
jgi:hypothetical protein